jgi:HK97 gp10 family phage protein
MADVVVKVKTTKSPRAFINSVKKDIRSVSRAATYDFSRSSAAYMRRTVSVKYPPSSRPGEPPRMRTGHLRSSIYREKVADMHHRVTVGAEYGVYVEYGTRNMAARPFFRPAIELHKREFIIRMRNAGKSAAVTHR